MSKEELESKMSEDLKAVLQECKSGSLAIVGGRLIEADPDEVPFVLMLDREVYNHLFAISASLGVDPEVLVMDKIQEVVDGSGESEDDFPYKTASDEFGLGDAQDDDSTIEDMLSGSVEPPPTDDGMDTEFLGWGAGKLSEDTNPTVANKEKIARISHETPFDGFKKLVTMVHAKKSGDVNIQLSFNDPGEVELALSYPEDGIDVNELEDGGIDNAISKVNKQLQRFYKIAFTPKVDPNTDIKAVIGAKVVEFDKSLGKYLVQIGEDTFIHVSPEDVDKL